MPYILL